MANGDLRGDPAADAMPNKIELFEAERVKQLKIMENGVFNAVRAGKIVRAVAARMRGRNDAHVLRKALVKGHQVAFHAMNVCKAMQIYGRFA